MFFAVSFLCNGVLDCNSVGGICSLSIYGLIISSACIKSFIRFLTYWS